MVLCMQNNETEKEDQVQKREAAYSNKNVRNSNHDKEQEGTIRMRYSRITCKLDRLIM